jgi:hypothetical protein
MTVHARARSDSDIPRRLRLDVEASVAESPEAALGPSRKEAVPDAVPSTEMEAFAPVMRSADPAAWSRGGDSSAGGSASARAASKEANASLKLAAAVIMSVDVRFALALR